MRKSDFNVELPSYVGVSDDDAVLLQEVEFQEPFLPSGKRMETFSATVAMRLS